MADSSTPASPVAAPEMPIPMGVPALTGTVRDPLTEDDLAHISPDSAAALARTQRGKVLAVDSSVDDPLDLTQTGWGVLFASDADSALQAALQPLIDHRRSQVKDDSLCRVFTGVEGVKPQQKATSWAAARGVSLSAPVSPDKGVPYYLLIVGSPERIPFEFQQQLDLQWAVGRLHFDDVAGYKDYAEKVVEYETGKAPAQSRRAAVWLPRNLRDLSTPLLAGTLAPDFLGAKPLGQRQKFQVTGFVGKEQATKDNLTRILSGKIDGGAPAVLFTGSHGAEWPIADPDQQRRLQGALVTQSWVNGNALKPEDYFCADDIPADAQVHGLMYLMFACFGGGCPDNDSYFFAPDGSRIPLTPKPLVASLPQALLRRGALAVIAHVDRAFSYAFQNVAGTPQSQLLRTPLELLMKGQTVGLATDPLNLQWSTLAALLGQAQAGTLPGVAQPRPPDIANLFVARDDARNYIVLGDPAARLDVTRFQN